MSARVLAVAVLAALSLSAPALRAQIPAEVREAAADRVWIRDYLRLYDQVLTMQAATGRITGAQADAQLAAAGRELYTQGYREPDMAALRDALRAAAGPFLDGVEAEIAASTSWSGDLTPESYRELTSGMLRYVRSELDRALARGADPVTALRAATLLLAMARGYESLPDDLDFFVGSRDRAAATVPGIELMPIDGGVRLLPPPVEARPPVISSPGPRVNTAGGGGATRVVLRGGTVEAEARLVGRGATDVVGRTARPRADGQPDTEIELLILGPGLVIVGMEVRHEPTDAGRLANRVLGTWSTLRNSGRPLLGVMVNRGLLNRADGQMGGISLGDRATLSLYIQDDGQIERSADPGSVVVFFQGGERATFPITRGGAGGGALAGGGVRPPAGGAGGGVRPPAGGAGGGVRPPAGGNPPIVTTIPRSFPPVGGMPPTVPVVPTGGGGAPAGGGGAPATAFNGTLRPDRTTYTQGQPMMVTFAAFPGTNDWIALAPAGAAAESYGEWRWTERRQSGALPFTAPAPGQYELRAYLDWPNGGHTVRVRTPFTVTAGAAPPVVSGGGGVPPAVGGGMPPAGGGGAPGGGTVPSRLVSLQASWVGMDADVVSKGGEVRPDGSLDAHFRLQPTFSSWQDVDYVTLYSSDAAGNASGGQVWTTRAGSYWVLGVLANAMNLNAGYAATLGKFNGTVTLDLYAGDSGWFTQGRTFVIEIGLGTAQPGRQVVTVGAAGTPVTGGGGGAPVTPPAAFAGTITTDRATYAQGEMITVRFSNFPATNDWIALAAAGAPAESYGEWKWTDGSSTSGQPSGAPRRDGTLTFTAPAPGNYEVRAFLNWPGGGTTVRATSAFTVAAAGPTFVSLPADFPATLQWESEGGWTGTWTRRGTSDQFDAAYARSSGERVTTVEEMTGAGNQVRVRRLASSDNILCTLEGTIQTTTRIEGTGACPSVSSGWWWRLTVPAAPAGVETATAGTNAVPLRGRDGQRFRYYCPPNSTGGTVWGTDVYTDDSAICGAAVHAGVIALAAGGTVEIEIRPGLASYQGSARNGVTSSNYGAWSGSFVFVGAGGAVPPGGGGQPPPGNACGRRIGTGIIYKWESLGGEGGFLGCPTSDEAEATPSPQGTTGRWASFAGASGLIVWHATGQRAGQAYEVHGDISILYYGMGGSASWLGFPVSDEYDAAGGRRSDFEGGYIHWTAATRETKAYPYGQGPAAAFAGMIATDRQSYGAGEAITVTFTNFPGTNDWLTIAPAGAPAEQYGEWQWTNHQAAGTLTFTAPAAGSYEVRAYANWPDAGYTVVAAVPITVGAAGGGGGYPRDLLVAYDAAWIGMDVDGVGSGGSGPPDGAADGHFTLDIDINTPYEVRYIVVYTTDAQGNPAGGQYWHTQNTGNWPLGVYLQGSRLNDGHVASLGTHSGYRRFDLVAANSGYFNAGQHFVVEVDVGLSEPLRRLVVVGGVAAGGGGAPAGGEGAVTVYANQGAPVSTAVLEAGRWYILEASGTISVWDSNADKIDAVWCYWVDRCGAAGEHWAQLRVDGMGLSDLSAAAGGPSPLPYDSSHVYRVYVQGQGRPLQLVVADAAAGSAGDNGGAFVVRLTPQ